MFKITSAEKKISIFCLVTVLCNYTENTLAPPQRSESYNTCQVYPPAPIVCVALQHINGGPHTVVTTFSKKKSVLLPHLH